MGLVTQAWSSEKRLALVIGNGTYKHTTRLPNTLNDASSIAVELRKLDFIVYEGLDLNHNAFGKILDKFTHDLKGADVGLLFYAGHGMQINGQNYLLSVDAGLKTPAALKTESIRTPWPKASFAVRRCCSVTLSTCTPR